MAQQTLLDKLESFNEQLNLVHYWIIILKYKKLLLILPIFLGLLGYLIALNIDPIFKSNATLVIEKEEKNIVDIDEVYGAQGVSAYRGFNYINNQIQIIKSDEIVNGIFSKEDTTKKIKKLVAKVPEGFFSKYVSKFKKFINPNYEVVEDKKGPSEIKTLH